MLSSSEVPQDAYIHVQLDEESENDDSRFYLDRPVWRVTGIAHGLAQTARFGGQADEFLSVAEHSCLVAALMSTVTGGNPLEGLLHDAHESVLTDIPSPLKQLMPEYRVLEDRMERSVREHFGLPPEKSVECKRADWLALFIEAAQVLPGRGMDFVDKYDLRDSAMLLRDEGWRVRCMPWREAKGIFLRTHRLLTVGAPPPGPKRTWADVDIRDIGGLPPQVALPAHDRYDADSFP